MAAWPAGVRRLRGTASRGLAGSRGSMRIWRITWSPMRRSVPMSTSRGEPTSPSAGRLTCAAVGPVTSGASTVRRGHEKEGLRHAGTRGSRHPSYPTSLLHCFVGVPMTSPLTHFDAQARPTWTGSRQGRDAPHRGRGRRDPHAARHLRVDRQAAPRRATCFWATPASPSRAPRCSELVPPPHPLPITCIAVD